MSEPSDTRFTLNAHSLRAALLDIVDDEWMNDRLPDDDISIPPDHDVPSEDEVDDVAEYGKPNTDKWTELGLNELQHA